MAYVDGHETKWNDPGSVLALPSATLSAAGLLADAGQRARLREIAYAAIDHAFGRNPTGRHFSYDGPREIEGVERGWYSFYLGGVGELEEVPFTFDGAPKAPSYPYDPEVGNISWTEGWVSFNTAFNRSLAVLAYFESGIEIQPQEEYFKVRLRTPWNYEYGVEEPIYITATTAGGDEESIKLVEATPLSTVLEGLVMTKPTPNVTPNNDQLEVTPGESVRVSYGYGYYEHSSEIVVPEFPSEP